MRKITHSIAIWPLLVLLASCAGPSKCPFASEKRLSTKSCSHGECLAPHGSAQCADTISPLDREYYQALDRRTTVQEELSADRAMARKSGTTPAIKHAIDEKRRELRRIESEIERMDARRPGTTPS